MHATDQRRRLLTRGSCGLWNMACGSLHPQVTVPIQPAMQPARSPGGSSESRYVAHVAMRRRGSRHASPFSGARAREKRRPQKSHPSHNVVYSTQNVRIQDISLSALEKEQRQIQQPSVCILSDHSCAHRLSLNGISLLRLFRDPSVSAFQAQYSPSLSCA